MNPSSYFTRSVNDSNDAGAPSTVTTTWRQLSSPEPAGERISPSSNGAPTSRTSHQICVAATINRNSLEPSLLWEPARIVSTPAPGVLNHAEIAPSLNVE